MKKAGFLFLTACLFFTGCAAFPSGPVTVSAPASSGSAPFSQQFEAQLQQQAALQGASRTESGVYYRPNRLFESSSQAPLPEGSLTMGQAAQRASDYAAAMGLPTTDLVWEVSLSQGYESAESPGWYCQAALPPYTSHVIEYQSTLEAMQPHEYNWSVTVCLGAATGRLLWYYCFPVDPFDLQEHPAEERQAHLQAAKKWQSSEEFRQVILSGMETLGVGPVKRLLPPTDTCLDWRAELENGDTYFVGAFYGKKELYELQYSDYYVNGDQVRQ